LITRRTLTALGLLALSPLGRGAALAQAPSTGPALGPAEPMDFDILSATAKALRDRPRPARAPVAFPERLEALTYGPLQEVSYPPANALYADSPYPVTFFPLGTLFRRPVKVHALSDGAAREVLYRPDLFKSPEGNPFRDLPADAGFAGFRLQNAAAGLPGDATDWLAFLGASYFRAAGDANQYGISARGVAIDTAPMPGRSEEFPEFTRFYVAPVRNGSVTILALMEGESLTGAFRFQVRKAPRTVVEVESRLFFRRAVDRLGIAPLTSMMWFSEGPSRYLANDWRPEVHDSDGLLMHTGAGEAIWRPLNNPPVVSVSAFADRSPKGFGLLQRDRAFASYVDDGYMENRPNLWVEPKGDWGAGSVQLVEIPAHQEYDDNIVAMWVPDEPVGPGQDRAYRYALHWPVTEPVASPLARCVSTRTDRATWLMDTARRPGRPNLVRQFALEFEGAVLAGLDPNRCQASIAMSRGVAEDVNLTWGPYESPSPWRLFFKAYAEGREPVEIRLFLKDGARTLSETWLFQLHPEAPGTIL
jgi:glucans biosynthesis protein